VTIGGTASPYFTEGRGVPCIVVGLAPAYAPLYSDRLKQHIRCIFVDFKNTWGAEAPGRADGMTLDMLVEELDDVRRALDLEKVCVLGHSTSGVLALEYAIRHPDRTSHGILVGVPPFYNRDVPKMRAEFWKNDASPERKAVRKQHEERLSDATLRSLSPRDAFAMRYVRNAATYFYDPSYDFSWAWIGRDFSVELLDRFFNVILADYDPRPRLMRNTVPLFLALGRYDYAVPHTMWRDIRIPQLTNRMFERSGHFPMLEEKAAFDQQLIQWLKTTAPGFRARPLATPPR
jgi:proline iminopeptidase